MPLIHFARLARHTRPTRIIRSQLSSPRLQIHPSSCSQLPLSSIQHNTKRTFTTTLSRQTTLNQVRHGARKPRKKRTGRSPILSSEKRPEIQGVCLRVGTTKPKKPNSGERKMCRVRLSNGREVNAYIPGEGHNVQQHSVVLLRGGKSQDCPGVKYRCIRGAADLGGVPNRLTSRSKYGTKKPKAAAPPPA